MRFFALAFLVSVLSPAAATTEEYVSPNERVLWGYAGELFDLTRSFGIVGEKTEEEILALLPETFELLSRFNADLLFWSRDLTERGILDNPGSFYQSLRLLLQSISDKVSTTIAVFLDGQYERGAYFIASLRR
ncbi:MAG TPA: hypothetical protein ENN88_01540, partial [Candidatus Coatesbacteria bacterium]|nr:hypothetical protein [Candidatus Coatesbacteria bacterium]